MKYFYILFLLSMIFISAQGEVFSPIQCESHEVVTNFDGNISSNLGPGNYAPDRTCTWVIDFLPSSYFSFRFLSFNTEFAYDVLSVYQGSPSSDPSADGKQFYQFSGTLIPPSGHSGDYFSIPGPRVTVVWAADNLVQSTGFIMAYSVGACSGGCSGHGVCWQNGCVCDPGYEGPSCNTKSCSAGCGAGTCDPVSNTCTCPVGSYGLGCSQDFCQPYQEWIANSGTFSDHIGPGTYLPSTRCQWYIKPASPSDSMRLDFLAFDLELEFDALRVYNDLPSQNGQLIAEYTGPFPDSPPPSLVSVTGLLYLDFTTNNALQRTGFTASFTALSCPDRCGGRGACLEAGLCHCYPGWRGASCAEQFCEDDCSGHGECVNGTLCSCDPSYSGALCNVCQSEVVGDCPPRCAGSVQLSAHTGTLSDGAGPYVENMNCRFLVAPSGDPFDSIVLEFSYFELSLDRLARVIVSVPEDSDSPLAGMIIGEYSGTTKNVVPPPIVAKNVDAILVTFATSSGATPHPGFEANYYTITCPNSCSRHGGCTPHGCVCEPGFSGSDCSTNICVNGCNGHGACNADNTGCVCDIGWYGPSCVTTHCTGTTSREGSSGSLYDHNPLLAQAYAPYSDCHYDVSAPAGGYIYFSRLQTESGVDVITLQDLATPHEMALQISGALLPYPLLYTTAGFTLDFVSDGQNEFTGFELNWQALHNCPEGCSNAGYCLPSNECSCFGGSYGLGCERSPLNPPSLLTNSSFSGVAIRQYEWHYYDFDVYTHALRDQPSERAPHIEISTSDTVFIHSYSDGSEYQLPILYVRYNDFPTLTNYDQRDTLNVFSKDHLIQIKTPRAGRWYVGIYGYTAQKYSLALSITKPPIGGQTSSQEAGYAFSIIILVIACLAVAIVCIIIFAVWLYRRRSNPAQPKPASEEIQPAPPVVQKEKKPKAKQGYRQQIDEDIELFE